MVEMRKEILAKVSTLETAMWKLYDGFVTMHKVVFDLHGLKQWRKRFFQTLRDIHPTITHVKEWIMQ